MFVLSCFFSLPFHSPLVFVLVLVTSIKNRTENVLFFMIVLDENFLFVFMKNLLSPTQHSQAQLHEKASKKKHCEKFTIALTRTTNVNLQNDGYCCIPLNFQYLRVYQRGLLTRM